MACRAAGETLRGLDLRGVEHRKHLMAAGLDESHGRSLAGGARRNHQARGSCPVIRQPAAVGRAGKTEFRKCLPAIDGVIMEPIQAAGELEPLRR
jgi:hypothetical protein